MRTRPAHIEPSCEWCNEDHNPDIPCRCEPESVRFRFKPKRKPVRKVTEVIRDASGKIVAVKVVSA